MKNKKIYINGPEAMAILDVSRDTFYRWVRDGLLPYDLDEYSQCYWDKKDIEKVKEIIGGRISRTEKLKRYRKELN